MVEFIRGAGSNCHSDLLVDCVRGLTNAIVPKLSALLLTHASVRLPPPTRVGSRDSDAGRARSGWPHPMPEGGSWRQISVTLAESEDVKCTECALKVRIVVLVHMDGGPLFLRSSFWCVYGKYNEAKTVAFALIAHCLDTETKKGIE
jgi:hypothetical protein